MRRNVKAKAAIYSAATAALFLGAAGVTKAQTVVSQYSGDNFAGGAGVSWNNDIGGAPAGTAGATVNNLKVANVFGTHAGVNVSAGGFTVPTSSSTPPGGLTNFTVAAVFDATSAVTTGNAIYQAESIYGYDVGGSGTPDMGIGFGGSTGQSFVAGVGTSGSGDLTIDTGALSLNTVHTVVMQVEDSGSSGIGTTGTAGIGTFTLYVDGALVSQWSGYTIAAMDPSRLGGSFGLGGNFGTTPTKGLLGLVQVINDTAGVTNGQALSASLAATYGGANELYTWNNTGTSTLSNGSNYVNGSAPDITGAAEVLIANGGTATIGTGDVFKTASLVLGNGVGTSGNITQTGGTYNASGSVTIGAGGGTGIYTISGGTLNVNTNNGGFHLVGNTASGAAATSLLVSGTAVINNNAEFDIGYTSGSIAGAATLNISGGTINQTGGGILVGNGVGTVGNLYMSGGTLNNTGGTFVVSNSPNSVGVFNMSGGTINSNQIIVIGEGNASNGTMVMNSGTINLTGQLWVADANNANNQTGGNGTFIMNGGTIIANNWFVVGRGGSTVGVLTMNGGSIVHTQGGGDFEVGSYGGSNGTPNNSTLNINAGASLTTAFIRDESPNGGTQSVYLNGGTLISNNGDGGFIGGHTNGGDTLGVYLRNLGVNLNAGGNGGEMGITSAISHSNIGTDNAIDGGINIIGGGNVTLGGNNTFTGNISVTNSELQVGSDSNLGLGNIITLNNGEIHNNGGEIGPGGISASRIIQLKGTGYLTPGWSGFTENAPIVDFPGTTGNNLSIPFDSGVLTLTASNSYTGTTTLGSVGVPGGAAGQYYWNDPGAQVGLALGNDNALPAGTLFTIGSHPLGLGVKTTFNMNGHQATIGGLVGQTNAHIDNANTGTTSTLTLGSNVGYSASVINSATSYTYAGTIQNSAGTINIVKMGPGIQVLSGSNLYTGSTTINAGKLYFNSPLLSSTVTVNSTGTLGGTGVIGAAVTVNSGATVEGGYLGAGSLNLSGGVSFASGSNLSIGNISNYPSTGNAAVLTTGLTDSGTIDVTVASALGGLAIGKSYNLLSFTSETGGGTFVVPPNSLPARAAGSISDTSVGGGAGTIVLTITGTDFLKWTGANGTAWNTSAVNWKLNSNNAPTQYIDNPGDTVVFDDSAGGTNQSVTIASPVHPNAVTFNNSSVTYTLSGAGGIAGLTGITKMNAGLVVVDTSNAYTGGTQVQQGTLQLGTGGSLAATNTLTLGNGTTSGTFVLGDSTGAVNTTVAALSSSGTGTSNSIQGGNASAVSTLSVVTSAASTFSGTVGGANATATNVAISVTGGSNGSLTLGGNNNYTGGTTLNSGTLIVTNSNSLGTGPVSLTGTAAPAVGGGEATAAAVNGLVATTADVVIPNAFNLNNGNIIFNTNGHTMNLSGAVTNNPMQVQVITPIGGGNLILSGPLNISSTLAANNGDNSAIEESANGTTVTVTGTGNISGFSLAWYNTTNSLILNPAGTLNVTNPTDALDVGQQGGNGVVVQNGGTINAGNIWLGRWDGAYGSYTMNAGTLTTTQILEGGAANGNGNSVWIQNGGIVNNTGFTTLGQQGASHANWVLNNGSYTSGNTFTISNGTCSTDATIVNGNFNASNIVLAGNGSDVQAILNLNGGNVSTGSITARNSAPLSIVNFNGAQVIANASSSAFLTGMTQANVYSGGAIFNTSGNSVMVTQSLTSAGGTTGLASVPASAITGGTGYTGAPVVVISGGGGTGATGYANINSAGTVTGVTITNPGIGYNAGSTPTFTFYGGGGTAPTVNSITTVTNGDGGLTKLGAGTLTLAASSSYTGNTQVKAGTLAVSNATALGTGFVNLYNGSKLAVNFTGPVTSLLVNSSVNTNDPNNFTPVISASGNSVQLTKNANSEGTSVFLSADNAGNTITIDDTKGFVANFTYSHSTSGAYHSVADGITFALQELSPNAVGQPGGALGYGGITQSVAMGLEIYSNQLEAGLNGVLTGSGDTGNAPGNVPFLSASTSDNITVLYTPNLTTGIGTLTETVTSNSNGASASISQQVDVASVLGGGSNTGNGSPTSNFAYVGFTGATGGVNDSQFVSNFSFSYTGTTLANAVLLSNAVNDLPGASSTIQLAAGAQYGSATVGPITIGAGGTLAVSTATTGVTRGVLTTPSVTLNSSSGTLDVGVNALDITTQSLASVNAMVKTGYANGNWNGSGISSSAATGDLSHLTALGTISNTQQIGTNSVQMYGNGAALGLFDGISPGASDVLVKYTYYGDTDLSGQVDGTDYGRIDNAYSFNQTHSTGQLTGWFNGDFNYDGVIDGSDYTLMDNAFNQQGASLASLIASPTAQVGGSSAVPEPTTLGLIAIGASALLGRRRRRL